MALTESKRKAIIIAGSIICGLVGLVVLGFVVLVIIAIAVGGPSATTTAGGATQTASPSAATSAPASTAAAPASATTSAPAAPDTNKAAGALAALTVKEATTGQGDGHLHPSFHLDEDPDGNGCITRHDVLRRDLTAMTLTGRGCAPDAGTLTSPYTGASIGYRLDDNDVRADQLVSSANAWLTGATDWDEAKRTAP